MTKTKNVTDKECQRQRMSQTKSVTDKECHKQRMSQTKKDNDKDKEFHRQRITMTKTKNVTDKECHRQTHRRVEGVVGIHCRRGDIPHPDGSVCASAVCVGSLGVNGEGENGAGVSAESVYVCLRKNRWIVVFLSGLFFSLSVCLCLSVCLSVCPSVCLCLKFLYITLVNGCHKISGEKKKTRFSQPVALLISMNFF